MQELATTGNEKGFAELWSSFTIEQQRWAIARINTTSDVAAAEIAKVPASTMQKWKNKHEIESAIRMMVNDAKDSAMQVMERNIMRALQVKLDGLDVQSDVIAQAAATEILDRVMGKATQRIAPVMPNGQDAYQPNVDTPEMAERLLSRMEQLAQIARQRRLEAQAQANIQVVDSTAIPIDTPIGKENSALEQD